MWAHEKGYIGKHAPMVHSLKIFEGPNSKEKFSVAVMEKIDYTSHTVDKNHPARIMPTLFRFHENDNARKFADLINPGAMDFHLKLRENFAGRLDMHDGNYMFRKDGTFVWTDPVYGSAASQVKRFRASAPAAALAALINLLRFIFESSIQYRRQWIRAY
jgi:hypothetical protein